MESDNIQHMGLPRGDEDSFQSLADNIPDPIARFNRKLQFVYVNKTFLKLTGRKKSDVVGKTNVELGFKEPLASEWTNLLNSVFEKRVGAEMQTFYPQGDKTMYIFTKVVPEFNNQGEVETLLAIGRDITKEKAAEREIIRLNNKVAQRATNRYLSLFNNMQQGFCIVEVIFNSKNEAVDFRFVEVNPTFEKQTGIRNAVGRTVCELKLLHDEGELAIYGNIAITGNPAHFESQLDSVWYEIFAFCFYTLEKNQVAVLFNDITERKLLEQRQYFITEVTSLLAGLDTVEKTMQQLGEKIGKYFGVAWCLFAEQTKDKKESVTSSYGWQHPGLPSLKSAFPFRDFLSDEELASHNTGKLTIVSDTKTDARVINRSYAALDIRSFVIIPLAQNNAWEFLISIIDTRPREWNKTEIDLLQEIASRIWMRVERARAQEALNKNQMQMSAVFSALPMGVAVMDLNGKVILANKEMQRFLPASTIPSKDARWWRWRAYDEQGKPVEKDNFPGARAIRGEFMQSAMEMIYTQDDGKNVWTRLHYLPVRDANSNVISMVCVATDIDDLKRASEALRESEEKLMVTMESATDYAIITTDIEGNVEKWSSGAVKIFHYTQEEMMGQSADIIFTDEDRLAGVPQKEMRTAREQGRAADERWHQRKDGTRFFMSGVMRPIYNPTLTGYVKVARDVTKQKLFTEELHRLVDERTTKLQLSNEDLRQFAHVASHDLKEPARKIKMFNSRLEAEFGKNLPEKANTYIHKIAHASDRMISMIDGLLKYSKMDTLNLPKEQVDMQRILSEIQSDLELLIHEKNATITAHNLPVLGGFKVLLYQLFYNLVLNSLKFSRANVPVKIDVRCKKIKLDNQPLFKITITDNGIGFENTNAEKIFTTFTRLNSAEEYEGTGLGLALCKKIVLRHNGSIFANAELNKGATFTIILPES